MENPSAVVPADIEPINRPVMLIKTNEKSEIATMTSIVPNPAEVCCDSITIPVPTYVVQNKRRGLANTLFGSPADRLSAGPRLCDTRIAPGLPFRRTIQLATPDTLRTSLIEAISVYRRTLLCPSSFRRTRHALQKISRSPPANRREPFGKLGGTSRSHCARCSPPGRHFCGLCGVVWGRCLGSSRNTWCTTQAHQRKYSSRASHSTPRR